MILYVCDEKVLRRLNSNRDIKEMKIVLQEEEVVIKNLILLITNNQITQKQLLQEMKQIKSTTKITC